MSPPHYETVSRQFDGASTVHGLVCSVGGVVVGRCEDISPSAGLVRKMAELFNFCELPPERMRQTIVNLLP